MYATTLQHYKAAAHCVLGFQHVFLGFVADQNTGILINYQGNVVKCEQFI